MNQEDLGLKQQLQRAVRSQEAPPYLETRIRASIEAAARPQPRWRPRWAAVGVACAGLLGITIAYQLGHLRLTTSSQEAYIASVSGRVASIMRVGLGDHLHCAFFRKFPKNPPKMDEFVSKMGPEYSGLIPIVRKEVPERFRIEIAHRCRYHGRQFVHMVLRDDKQLLSLVVAVKEPGETLGQSFLTASVQRFEIASFETQNHLVYLISDLPGNENKAHLVAMAPAVKDLLAKIEL